MSISPEPEILKRYFLFQWTAKFKDELERVQIILFAMRNWLGDYFDLLNTKKAAVFLEDFDKGLGGHWWLET